MTIKDTAEEWQVTATSTPFKGAKTSVRTDEVVMPDGSVAGRDFQVHPGSVAVLALDSEDRVLVIRQYRHPVRHKLWEIPAGLLDVPGENPLHAAQRELFEETHVKAGDWRVLTDVYPSPGGSDEAVRIFLARDLSEAEEERFATADEEADMEQGQVPLRELVRGALVGELHNSCLVIGALALTAVLAGEGVESLRPADAPWPARPFEG
ncbi:NUDIX domain-containing protein [Streptomyces tsukubensis]|uniref:ADP-ribose pyrophosphatase n=1 Tax=Streptomyces tsukubensis TaxID=83656 RepID=A0A1V4AEY6_9ACTN|nr:NUDIX hydrolase [Streptomyces tsukubensis]OON82378.1 ADP-ribose pyrophosphatase [Streptomyces tsukubensis]QFR92879.1 NUDIX domain-containing protein [Streptomyces tsukubensis]